MIHLVVLASYLLSLTDLRRGSHCRRLKVAAFMVAQGAKVVAVNAASAYQAVGGAKAM